MWTCLALALLAPGLHARIQGAPDAPPATSVQSGRDRPITGIQVVGARRYTAAQLVNALGAKVGEPVDVAGIEKGIEVLWDAFRVSADVRYRNVPTGVELELVVVEMNVDLEPRFVGNAEIDVEKLKKWSLLENKGELFLYQSERVRQRLLEGYKKEGFAFAEIDVVRRGSDSGAAEKELPDVIFEIREGPKVRVKDVVIRGNDAMPEKGMWWWRDGLTKLAKTELSGPWIFNWFGEKYSKETLDADVLAMREVYRDRGYLDAVVEIERTEFTPDHTGVVLHVVVDEGPVYTVSSIELVGAKHEFDSSARAFDDSPVPLLFAKDELEKLLKIQVGKPFTRVVRAADSTALRDYYGSRGYLSHPSLQTDYFEFLEPELVFDADHHTVAVKYRLAQGRKRYIREVMFDGAVHTRDRVVRREVDMLPGEVADLTKIRKSLSRITGTSFFSDDAQPLQHREPSFTFKPTDDPSLVDLEYAVEEGKVVNFQIQGGVDSNSGIFGRLSMIMRNFDIADPPSTPWSTFGELFDKEAFHGAGQELELDFSPGTVVNSYRARFLEPDLFRTHFNRYSLELDLYRRERSQRFFDEDRNERRVRIGHEFTRNFTAFVGYTNQNIRVTALESNLIDLNEPDVLPLPDSIYQQEGTTNLSGVTLDFSFRDVDQVTNSKNGVTANWKNALYGGFAGGDYDFFKSYIETDAYWQIADSEREVAPGFHVGVGAGISQGYGDTSETPYTERYFLGGSRILRGFAYRGVGPNRGRNALGGETYVSGTLEFRYPLYSVTQPGSYRELETFRLTLFTDAGILGVDTWEAPFDDLRWTAGFGLGMVQPFPISLNFGFPIESGEGDRRQTFSFTILNLWF
ncbi:MAG: BamA/TamA family outer membrane protein [Planctomycetota bacterium]|nr:BamA/TamA family outer membrane protein [Planctomycetota bacterium]